MTVLRLTEWQTLIEQWCPMRKSGEVQLICSVLAQAIADEPKYALDNDQVPYKTPFFRGMFVAYCRLIGLDPVFVLEQIARANDSDVKRPKKPKEAKEPA